MERDWVFLFNFNLLAYNENKEIRQRSMIVKIKEGTHEHQPRYPLKMHLISCFLFHFMCIHVLLISIN